MRQLKIMIRSQINIFSAPKRLKSDGAREKQLVSKRKLIIEEVVHKQNEYSTLKCKHDEHDKLTNYM